MGGWGLVRRILSRRRGHSRAAQRGFTFIEVMIALSISVVVLLANIYLFNTAHRDLALARSITEATNLATGTLAVLKSRTIAQINATTNNVPSGLVVGTHTDDPNSPPAEPADPSDLVKRQQIEGTTFSRVWAVSNADIDGNGTPELVGDLVKVKIEVTWTLRNKVHRVSMTTFTTGNTQ
jgi:prepilin-type N-terminal cleavage/methylation domain-containing protein